MKLFKKKVRRGSIAIVLVFGMAMGIIMLGSFRVASAVYSSGVDATTQYADINSMRAICQLSSYRYMTDLMSLSAQRDTYHDMPGISTSVIFQQGLKALQDELMTTVEVERADGSHDIVPTLTWDCDQATEALSYMGTVSADTQADIMSKVLGKKHDFYLELAEDMMLDYSSPSTFMGTSECRVALKPIRITVQLHLKSEVVTEHLVVEGAFLYAQVGTQMITESGTTSPHTIYTMKITDDGLGSGVYIYRE